MEGKCFKMYHKKCVRSVQCKKAASFLTNCMHIYSPATLKFQKKMGIKRVKIVKRWLERIGKVTSKAVGARIMVRHE